MDGTDQSWASPFGKFKSKSEAERTFQFRMAVTSFVATALLPLEILACSTMIRASDQNLSVDAFKEVSSC